MPDAAAGTAPKLKNADHALVCEVWNAIPEAYRTYDEVKTRLGRLGFKCFKATFYRWRRAGFNATMPPLDPGKTVTLNREALTGIPPELVDALGLRMLIIAKGEGLDRVEDAIVKVATAIAQKAEQIATQLLEPRGDSETVTKGLDGEMIESKAVSAAADAAQRAVTSLATLTDAMHRIVASRVMFSLAHRNYAEGDRLSGEGKKYQAEAATISNAARADSAKTVEGEYQTVDAEYEDDAVTAMRDLEKRQ